MRTRSGDREYFDAADSRRGKNQRIIKSPLPGRLPLYQISRGILSEYSRLSGSFVKHTANGVRALLFMR